MRLGWQRSGRDPGPTKEHTPISTSGAVGEGALAFHRDRRTWAAYFVLGLYAYLETGIGPAMPFLRAELGLGIANLYPLTLGAATGAGAHNIDRATARLAIAGGGALLIAPLAVGAISDVAGMRWGFGIVAPLLVAAFACALVSGRWLRLRG